MHLTEIETNTRLAGTPTADPLKFLPDFHLGWTSDAVWTLPVLTFLVYVGMQWWMAWYPGAEPGGGGYVAQRMFSAKDEKNSLGATLWFNIAHYALRPWPWIVTGLVALVVYSPNGGIHPRRGIRAESGAGLCNGLARLSAAGIARVDGGGLSGRLHVHHRNAIELGQFVSRERFL